MATIPGTSGDDSLAGDGDDDVFEMADTGADTVEGRGGNDSFEFGAFFGAGDRVDGGADVDTLELSGDYSAGLLLSDANLHDVENVLLAAGGDYHFTIADDLVAAGVDYSIFGAGDITVDASAAADGDMVVQTVDGTLDFTGGGGDDRLNVYDFTAGTRIHGGGGFNELNLHVGGNYVFDADMMTGIDQIEVVISLPAPTRIVLTDGNVAAGEKMMIINLGGGETLRVNGAKEKDGQLELHGAFTQTDTLIGGKGDDTLNGRGGDDLVVGGKGADRIVQDAGVGDDTVVYNRLSDSKQGRSDTIVGVDAGDVVDLSRLDASKHQAADQAFVLVTELTGAEGEAMLEYDGGILNRTTLTLETNGRAGADMVIFFEGDATDFTGLVL